MQIRPKAITLGSQIIRKDFMNGCTEKWIAQKFGKAREPERLRRGFWRMKARCLLWSLTRT